MKISPKHIFKKNKWDSQDNKKKLLINVTTNHITNVFKITEIMEHV